MRGRGGGKRRERRGRVGVDRRVGAGGENARRPGVQRHDQPRRHARLAGGASAVGEHAAKDHPPDPRRAKTARAQPAFHRQVRHRLHLRGARRERGDVPGVVAGARPGTVARGRRHAVGVLSRDDAARGDEPLRARALDPLGDPGGDRVGRAARRVVSRRRGHREAGRDQRDRARQNRHAHDRRAGGRGLREFPARARGRGHGAGARAGGALGASAGARHRARRAGARRGGARDRGF